MPSRETVVPPNSEPTAEEIDQPRVGLKDRGQEVFYIDPQSGDHYKFYLPPRPFPTLPPPPPPDSLVAIAAERFLNDLGLTPDSVRGLAKEYLQFQIGVIWNMTSQQIVSFDSFLDDNCLRILNAIKSLPFNPPLDRECRDRLQRAIINAGLVRPEQTDLSEQFPTLFSEVWRKAIEWFESKSAGTPATISPKIEPSEAKTDGRTMQRETTITLEGDRYVTGGVTYLPLSAAAAQAQATEKNLRDWIKKDIKFKGRPIQTHTLPFTGRKLYVSEESIQRVANRFIKWRSGKPAGPAGAITIGERDDQSGYLGLPAAARVIGVDHHTMWLWTVRGKAPTDKPFDIIKCTTSDHFYIREKDVAELKKLVPRSGLQRGRRPQLGFQP